MCICIEQKIISVILQMEEKTSNVPFTFLWNFHHKQFHQYEFRMYTWQKIINYPAKLQIRTQLKIELETLTIDRLIDRLSGKSLCGTSELCSNACEEML